MSTVVLPALSASRTSIQVISSINTVSRASIGRGAFGFGFKALGWAPRTPAASRIAIRPQDRDMSFLLRACMRSVLRSTDREMTMSARREIALAVISCLRFAPAAQCGLKLYVDRRPEAHPEVTI